RSGVIRAGRAVYEGMSTLSTSACCPTWLLTFPPQGRAVHIRAGALMLRGAPWSDRWGGDQREHASGATPCGGRSGDGCAALGADRGRDDRRPVVHPVERARRTHRAARARTQTHLSRRGVAARHLDAAARRHARLPSPSAAL